MPVVENTTCQDVRQMEVLERRRHLLRPKEREWVDKISRTVRSRRTPRLSDRQSAVIGDIFQRVQSRARR